MCYIYIYTERCEPRRFFVTTAFQLCFRICHIKAAKKKKIAGNDLNRIHKFLVYVKNSNSVDENTSTSKAGFLFWKSEKFVTHIKSIYRTVL
jgi:hypothetical protein